MNAKVEDLCPQTKEDYKNSLMANDNGSFFIDERKKKKKEINRK